MDQKFLIKNILSAAEQGHKKALQDYVSRGVVNVVDEEGSTPLMYAAANGREEIVRLLLDKECIASNKLEYNTDTKYIDQINIYGWTALMQAACYGHLNVVISLIQRRAKVDIKNKWGATALVGASQGGYFGVVHKLLNVGAEVNPEGDSDGADTLTPLMAATQCGHVEIVQELLRKEANVDTKLKGTKWTALMLAALNKQLPVMELLLKHGADKSATDVNGQTAADLATALGHQDMVLLLTGKKLRECSEGEFLDIVKSGDLDRVKKVLETQKHLTNSQDKDGVTPLMLAANKGNVKMCEALLDRGASVNTTDEKYGWTALMLATHQRKYEVVQLLGERRADVNVRGKSGSTAFDVANMISDIKMIRLVANISVEQIQRKAPSATPPLSIPALSGELEAMVQPPPSSETNSDVGGATSEVNVDGGGADSDDKKNEPPTLDLTDLKHRLDKAYRTPTPSISVESNDNHSLLKETPSQPRFPMKPHPTSVSKQLATPIPSSLSSSIASEISSPSSSLSNFSVGRSGVGDPFSEKSLPSSPSSSNKKKPGSLYLKGRSPAPKTSSYPRPLGTPGSSRSSSSSILQSKFSSGPKTASPMKSKTRDPSLFFPLRGEKDVRSSSGSPRRRADTAPVRASNRRRGSLPKPKPSSGAEIKSALEQASLGHLFPIFREQGLVDTVIFLTLNKSDLKELGMGGEDTDRVLSLIAKLKLVSPARPPLSALASPGPMFTFIP